MSSKAKSNSLKVASWNINSVRARAEIVERFLTEHQPDILCLQETKVVNETFPEGLFRRLGYNHLMLNGQRMHHGVAIISKLPMRDEERLDWQANGEARHIGVRLDNGLRIENVYIPAGGDEPDRTVNPKFGQKLDFIQRMIDWSGRLDGSTLLVGDFNVAPLDSDNGDPSVIPGLSTHVSEPERAAFHALEQIGLTDVVRPLVPEGYTYWDYKQLRFPRNEGMRIDFVLGSHSFADRVTAAAIHRNERKGDGPSDHVPVVVDLDLGEPEDDDRPMIF